jgi:ribonucleoside-diphosphate reductase alpha chain
VDSKAVERVDWLKLIGDIKAYGIRHSMTTALPPSGRTALLLNVNTSIEPFLTFRPGGQWVPPVESLLRQGAVQLNGSRGLITTLPGQIEGWPQSASSEVSLFRESVRISPKQHMATAAVACHWTDDSVSKTVNLASSSSPSDVMEVFDTALSLGFKAISVYRANSHPSEFAQEKLDA